MSAKKVIGIIVSSVLVLVLGFCITWTVINFDAIKYAMSGTALYTKEDLEAAYQDGYNSAGLDHKDLQDIIADLRADLDAETAKYNTANANYLEYVAKYGEASEEAKTAKAQVQELEKEVSNLETTIKSYEAFKEAVEAENKVTATFEYDGAIILLQSYDKGSTITGVTVPEDTDEIQFNGWTVNGEAVDLSTYTISENTTFVADLTYYTYYTVTFKVDDTEYDSQRVLSGSAITLPESPTKDDYVFIGWSIDGENVVDITADCISAHTTYIAVFKFVPPELESLHLGCAENGTSVWSDGSKIYYSFQNSHYVLDTSYGDFVWRETTWMGLTSFYGEYVWTDGTNVYYSSPDQHYVLNTATSTWEKKVWKGNTSFYGVSIWTDGENYYCNYNGQYVLNKETSTWEKKTWNGLTSFDAECIWTDGTYIYYSEESEHYILNKETSTWEEIIWNGLTSFAGEYIWTDGTYIYHSSTYSALHSYGDAHYVLNKETSTWEEITWTEEEYFSGKNIWTDGKHFYLTELGRTYQFVR